MRTASAAVLGIAIAVILAAGIVYLFLLRFEAGDIYPPYSSLRSDPLGTKVLYESLAECAGVSVSRNYLSIEETRLDPDSVLLFLGDTLSPGEMIPTETRNAINGFLGKGGRCVVALLPRRSMPSREEATDEKKAGKQEEKKDEKKAGKANAKKKAGKPDTKKKARKPDAEKKGTGEKTRTERDVDEEAVVAVRSVSVTNWLRLSITNIPLPEAARATLARGMKQSGLPASLSCHTTGVFEGVGEGWRTIYERDGRPVMVERQVGKGTLVLSALSYFVSNEALKKERHVGLLVWLMGRKKVAVFDENHHGVSRTRNLAMVVRHHNLHWALGVLALLAVLLLWQKGSSLLPREEREDAGADAGEGEGKDSMTGLTNLLRNNVPVRSILSTCVQEWEKVNAGAPDAGQVRASDERIVRKTAAVRERVAGEEELPVHQRDPAKVYNEIAAILKQN